MNTSITTHDENHSPPSSGNTPRYSPYYTRPVGARTRADPLVGEGRHLGRAGHAFFNPHQLLVNGLRRMKQPQPPPNREEHRMFVTFCELLRNGFRLQSRLEAASDEEVSRIAGLLRKGTNSARSTDMKCLKSAILEWITPPEGLRPPLERNKRIGRGFDHPQTGLLLCPSGLDWYDERIQQQLRAHEIETRTFPNFMYENNAVDWQAVDPWKGFLRNKLLVKAFKFVFTGPSSADPETQNIATKSSNAQLHGMREVTPGSLAYIATLVFVSLSSSEFFSAAERLKAERFYTSILDALEEPGKENEVSLLFDWWNGEVFPVHAARKRMEAGEYPEGSVLAALHRRRLALKEITGNDNGPGQEISL